MQLEVRYRVASDYGQTTSDGAQRAAQTFRAYTANSRCTYRPSPVLSCCQLVTTNRSAYLSHTPVAEAPQPLAPAALAREPSRLEDTAHLRANDGTQRRAGTMQRRARLHQRRIMRVRTLNVSSGAVRAHHQSCSRRRGSRPPGSRTGESWGQLGRTELQHARRAVAGEERGGGRDSQLPRCSYDCVEPRGVGRLR